MKKISLLLITVLLTGALFSCKRQDRDPIETAGVQTELAAALGKSAAETAKEKGVNDTETGKLERYSFVRLPYDAPFKMTAQNGAACEGAEEFQALSYLENYDMAGEGTVGEEYVYYFDADLVNTAERYGDRLDYFADRLSDRVSCTSYSSFMEKFGDDGWIVIGRAAGPREGRIAYFQYEYESGTSVMEEGRTFTDFYVEETLFGTPLEGRIRIQENYQYCFSRHKGRDNHLLELKEFDFALSNDYRILLFIKKSKHFDCYEIFGGSGGLPLTDDYKDYDEDYLNHLGAYLNEDPEEYNESLMEDLNNSSYYQLYKRTENLGRDPKEALEANKDDLLVALAQKYRIKIWPLDSKVYQQNSFPPITMPGSGCLPDGMEKAMK